MALQTSGPISLADIQGEFGGSNPISLSEYYGAASGLPSSGAISLGDFYGLSDLTVSLLNRTYSSAADLGFSVAGVRYNGNGNEEEVGYDLVNNEVFYSDTGHDWLTAGAASNLELRATVTSSSNPKWTASSDSRGVWISASNSPEWALSDGSTSDGSHSVTLTIEARNADSGAILGSCTVSLTVDQQPFDIGSG